MSFSLELTAPGPAGAAGPVPAGLRPAPAQPTALSPSLSLSALEDGSPGSPQSLGETVEGILGFPPSPSSGSSKTGVGRQGFAQRRHRRSPTPLPPLFEGGFTPYRTEYSKTPSVVTPSPKSEKSEFPGWAFPELVLERPEPFQICALTAEGGQPLPEESDNGEGDRQPQHGADTGMPDEGDTPLKATKH